MNFILITVFLEVLNTDKVRTTMKKTKTLIIFSVCNVTLRNNVFCLNKLTKFKFFIHLVCKIPGGKSEKRDKLPCTQLVFLKEVFSNATSYLRVWYPREIGVWISLTYYIHCMLCIYYIHHIICFYLLKTCQSFAFFSFVAFFIFCVFHVISNKICYISFYNDRV